MLRLPVRTIGLAAVITLVMTGGAAAQGPTITGVSAAWSHGASAMIRGFGFGTKAKAAPVVWDDASGTTPSAKWDGGWPMRSTNPEYNIAYRSPIRGISLPHQRVGRYLAGAHGESNGFDAGYNVMVWKNRTISFPSYSYVSWYQRADDAWVFGNDNYKIYDWSMGAAPYDLPNNWYAEYNPAPTSRTSFCTWHLNDDLVPGSLSDSSTWWGGRCTNPMGGTWAKIEMLIKWSQGLDGFVRIYDNGVNVLDYTGPTDRMSGTSRAEAIGGYSGESNPNNWRYFSDIYLDHTLAHVVIGNAPTYSESTVREVQIPTLWSDSLITVSVNLGALSEGQPAFLYVVDANGVVNEAGQPITLTPSNAPRPTPPSSLRIVR